MSPRAKTRYRGRICLAQYTKAAVLRTVTTFQIEMWKWRKLPLCVGNAFIIIQEMNGLRSYL